ncbi:hypothetical protein PR001_g13307 [Phytophthora rubi]|uniref:Uncharacterized protein n=1 Tax=Phytophthora rubi TaxID=129364 RepID=A0A6A3LR44_9STRA|nr:hypothetical protein PR001_g13307 [Phytophthora rubi]
MLLLRSELVCLTTFCTFCIARVTAGVYQLFHYRSNATVLAGGRDRSFVRNVETCGNK